MPDQPQVVYFLQQGDGGPIKIGIAEGTRLDRRLKQLQTASPLPLRLLGIIEGGSDLERRLHEKFAGCRLEGEWFSAAPDLLRFVRTSISQPDELMLADSMKTVNSEAASKPRSLSSLEAKLILHLEAAGQMVVTIAQAMAILGCSYDHTRQVLSRLANRRWLAPLVAGKYELIPAERGEYPVPDTNPLFIGSTLVEPYYFSYATAAFFYGLSTQASSTVYIATSVCTRRRALQVRGKDYRLVLLPEARFFGAVEVDAYGSRVQMAEPEKTIIDALDRPEYAGDIPEIAGMLWRGQSRLDPDKLTGYAMRFSSQALVQRLGYLMDTLGLALGQEARNRIQAGVGKSTCYLGRRGQWGTGGVYDTTWQIVDNVPRHELLAEIVVR